MGIGGLGMGEMIVIFLVVLLLFGAKRLPEIGSSLGKGIREFKGSLKEIETEMKTPLDPPAQKTRSKLHPTASATGTDSAEPIRLSSDPPAVEEEEATPPEDG